MEKTEKYILFENHGVSVGFSRGANWGISILPHDKPPYHGQLSHEQMSHVVSWLEQDSREVKLLSDCIDRNEDLRKRILELSASNSMLAIKIREILLLYEAKANIPSELFFELKQLTDNAVVIADKSKID